MLRLPLLALGALGMPVLLALSLAVLGAQWRTGEPVDSVFGFLAIAGALVMVVLGLIRYRARLDPGTTLLTRAARKLPLLMIPGALLGAFGGALLHLELVGRVEARRLELSRSVCHELKLKAPRCPLAADACLPRPLPSQPRPEDLRACIEARLD